MKTINTKTKCSALTVTSALFLVLTSTASAQLLISDNFNTANTGINDDLAARQSGSLTNGGTTTVSWLSGHNGANGGTQTISGDALSLAGGASVDSNAALDLDFAGVGGAGVGGLLANGAFQVSFNVTPSTASNEYVGSTANFSIGASAGIEDERPLIHESTDFGVIMKADGSGNVFFDGANSGTFSGANWAGGLAVFTVETANFLENTTFTVSLTVAGSAIDLNGGAAGNAFTGMWDADESNYMYLTSRGPDAVTPFDNYSVTAIPEPSAFALSAAIFSLLVCARRRRS